MAPAAHHLPPTRYPTSQSPRRHPSRHPAPDHPSSRVALGHCGPRRDDHRAHPDHCDARRAHSRGGHPGDHRGALGHRDPVASRRACHRGDPNGRGRRWRSRWRASRGRRAGEACQHPCGGAGSRRGGARHPPACPSHAETARGHRQRHWKRERSGLAGRRSWVDCAANHRGSADQSVRHRVRRFRLIRRRDSGQRASRDEAETVDHGHPCSLISSAAPPRRQPDNAPLRD